MTTFIILLYLAVLTLQYGLHFLNNSYLKQHGHEIPSEFKGAVDPSTLAKTSDYTLVKGQVSLVRSLFDSALTLLFIFGGLMACYDGWLASLGLGFISAGLFFFLLLSLAKTVIDLPFDLYNHFKVESRFGFNNMSFKLWCADLFKSLLLSTLLFGLVAAAALWLIQAAPQSWWLWVWALIVGFSLLMMLISPYVIEPLFFKFEPLNVEGLEDEIRAMMGKAGLSVSKVLQMDASKRSGHSNAYFTGFGKQKRLVILFFLSGILTFPLTPVFSILSRKDEYQADHFACELHGNPADLATALIQMSKENLSNLHPHPFYARFYYSHPPVVERVQNLRRLAS